MTSKSLPAAAPGFRKIEQRLRAWGDFDGAAHTQEVADALERDDLLQLTIANQAAERMRRHAE